MFTWRVILKKCIFYYIMPEQSFSPVSGGLLGTANLYGFMIVVSLMIIISGVDIQAKGSV
jgi:hypothetical protein